MIEQIEYLPPVADPVTACRLQTLWQCYREFPSIVTLWQSDGEGILCRFGDRLLTAGSVDQVELAAFVDFTGIAVVEGPANDLPNIAGFARREYGTMVCGNLEKLCGRPPTPQPMPDLREVFEILCACDNDFAANADYYFWLSDIRRRIRLGLATVALDERGATASVVAVGGGFALIGAVATMPEARGHRLAFALIENLCAGAIAKGLRPLVVVQTPSLIATYKKLGFESFGTHAVLTRQRDEGNQQHYEPALV